MISIRRAEAADLDFLVELVNHEDVQPFLGGRAPRDRDALAAEIERSTVTASGWTACSSR